MIKIILRGEEWGTRYGCTKERRLRVSIVCDDMLNNSTGTLCRQLDKAITGSVIRTRRLSPNCHLVGISSKLTDLIIQRLPQVRKEGNHKALTWRCIHWRANCWSSSFELNVLSRSGGVLYLQSPAFRVPLSWIFWPLRNPKTPNRYCMTTTITSPPAWSIRSFPLYINALPVKYPPLRSSRYCHSKRELEGYEPMKPNNNRQVFLARGRCDNTKRSSINGMTWAVFSEHTWEKDNLLMAAENRACLVQPASRCKAECPRSEYLE